MRRYHFHIVDGVEVFDPRGALLPSDDAARKHAENLASNIVDRRTKAIRVTNDEGAVLFRVPVQNQRR